MKLRNLALVVFLGLLLALAVAAPVGANAPAQCGPNNPSACEPPAQETEKKPTATDLPTKVPTETAVPVSQMQAQSTPDAEELAILCANLPVSSSGIAGVDSGNPAPVPESPPVPTAPPFSPWLPGGGGLLLGILIGMLLPAVSRAISGGDKSNPGGIIAIDAGNRASDAFYKEQDSSSAQVFPKVESGPLGDSFHKDESSTLWDGKGESSDPFIKGESSGDAGFHK